MKKCVLILPVLCMILSGCGNPQKGHEETGTFKVETETVETHPSVTIDSSVSDPAVTIYPLPNPIMDALENATFAISLEEGDAYVDDTGIMRMDVKVYSYDLFDMVDISGLKAGDSIVTHHGEITVCSLERTASGAILINGGLENDGMELLGDVGGVYYETGYNDTKNWYEVGEATLRVSTDLEFRDNMDLEKGEQIYYAGSFLVGEVTDYHFTPFNTTVRTENGQIVYMERIYTP